MSDYEHIVVPVLAGMGNGLMAQPMVRQLARHARRLTILARNDSIAGVFDRLAEVSEVRVFGNEPRQFASLLRVIRSMRADLCVIPYPSNRWQYSLLASASGAKRTVMHGYAVGRLRAMHDLPGVERVPTAQGRHDVLANLDLLRAVGIAPDETMPPAFRLESRDVAQAVDRIGIGGRLCAVHAGSGRTVFAQSKRWSPENWAALLPRLQEAFGLRPVLLEGPEDEGVGELMRRHVSVPVVRLGGPLAEAAAVLAACEVYVGSDSGLAHLAAAVNTPPVTLFGPSRPDEVCPFGYRDLVVQTPATCAPCFGYPQEATTPRVRCRPPYCIDRIKAELVEESVKRALGRSGCLTQGPGADTPDVR
jgi:ADP-heptose:LPS heptosyltransferase